MCIRDSVVAEHVRIRRSARLVLPQEMREDPILVFAGEIDPVSYTHLRAHETVLDLVCRLLLAKKQDTSSQRSSHSKVFKENDTVHTYIALCASETNDNDIERSR